MTDKLDYKFTKPDNWEWGNIKNARGASLRYGRALPEDKPVAHVIYIEGLSEYSELTFELAREFNAASCALWSLDRHGLGYSDRLLDNPDKQHAIDFEDDAADILQFIKDKIPDDAPVFLLGHSTGGLISLRALLQDQEKRIKGATITAPLLGVQNKIIKNKEALAKHFPMPKKMKEAYIVKGRDWIPRSQAHAEDKPEVYSSDPQRNKLFDHWMMADPNLRLGSPTYGWLKAACTAICNTRKPKTLKKIPHPIQVFTAGDDQIVYNKHTFKALKHLQNKEHYHHPDARHELLRERDEIRNNIVKKTIAFIKKHSAPKP